MSYAWKIALVTYDVVDDRRRERLSDLLAGYGPRVQLSVFEVQLPSAKDEKTLRAAILEIIDAAEDQVRMYRMDAGTANAAIIMGAREVEERRDWFIVR